MEKGNYWIDTFSSQFVKFTWEVWYANLLCLVCLSSRCPSCLLWVHVLLCLTTISPAASQRCRPFSSTYLLLLLLLFLPAQAHFSAWMRSDAPPPHTKRKGEEESRSNRPTRRQQRPLFPPLYISLKKAVTNRPHSWRRQSVSSQKLLAAVFFNKQTYLFFSGEIRTSIGIALFRCKANT